MKTKITIIFSVAICTSLIFFFTHKHFNEIGNPKSHNVSNEGMEDDAADRINWETRRYADPATGKIPDYIRMKELAYAATLPKNNGEERTAPLDFTNRGPWNVGGRTRAFGTDINNESHLLAGSCSGGMWRSTNGGASWTEASTLSQLKNSTCLTQDQRIGHSNVWYYGSGESYGASAGGHSGSYYLGDGVFKSVDSGATWNPLSSTNMGNPTGLSTGWQLVWNIANDNSAPDSISELYASTCLIGGIYRSIDGGTTWANVRSGGGAYFTDVDVSATGVVYATVSDDGGTSRGIWRSPNGTTWTKILPLTGFPTAYNRMVIGINPNNENEVYFLANTPNFGRVTYNYLGDPEWNSLWKYTYLSGDGDSSGGAWQDLSANLPNEGTVFDRFQVQGSYDMVVKVKPGSSNVVFVGGTNIYRSTTAFQDSTHTTMVGGYALHAVLPVVGSYTNHHPDQHRLLFSPSNPDVMYSANDGGVFKTLNNTDSLIGWTSLNNGYLTSMFYTCAIDHATSGNAIIIAGAQDNGSWYTNNTNPTTPWVQPRGGDGSFCAIADNQSYYYFSIQNAKMMKAKLNASGGVDSFARIDPRGIYNASINAKPEFINPYTLDPNNNNLMYLAGGKYLWRNDNLAGIPLINNWDSINTNWTQWPDSVPTANSVISAVAVCNTPANRVYYGTDVKRIYRVDNANTGTPTPLDITSTTTGAIFGSAYVSCIAVDPNDGNKLFVVFSNYGTYSIFYSADAGITWSKAAGNLEQLASGAGNGPSIRWLSILHTTDGTVYLAATSVGVFATDSIAGLNTVWVQQGLNSIGNQVCDMIDVRQSDGLVVVATHSTGIYSVNIGSVNDIAGVNDIQFVKNEFQLNAYPNPVVAATTIEFALPKQGKAILQIWDDCGRLVETLFNGDMQAGRHSIVFERKNLKSGMYYYSLIADNKRKTNKLILVH